jgi:spermidine synthase
MASNGWRFKAVLPFPLFFISGACGLIYEVVWSRMLVLAVGNTTLAVSLILAAFMTGLSLGSYYWGRHIEARSGRALAAFGGLEIGAGLSALLLSYAIKLASPIEIWIAQSAGIGSAEQIALRFAICFFLLFVPTFLMGGTFAVIGRHTIDERQGFGRTISLLYGVNTAGALTGAFLAGFFFIKLLGHQGSLAVAASLNVMVGIIAIACDFLIKRQPETTPKPISKKKRRVADQSVSRQTLRWVLLALAISGFCAMAYQVLWTRLLILIIDNSVYSFTIILSAFLGGMALGSFINALPALRGNSAVLLFAVVEIGIALSAYAFPFWIHYQERAGDESYLRFLLMTVPFGMLPPTLLMGMSLPLAAQIYHSVKGRIGESLGTVFAVNTIGGVLGAIAVSFLLIPRIGFRNSMLLLSSGNLVIGLAVAVTQIRLLSRRWILVAAGALLIVIGVKVMPENFFPEKYHALSPDSRVVYYKEALAATATIFETPERNLVLYLNGIPEVDTSLISVRTFYLMGALPGLLHPNPKNALMVTFGAGITASVAAKFVDRMDCVDLADQAREIAPYFARANDEIHTSKKVSLHVDDARHFLQNTDQRYSIIVSDATHPRVYDSWVLFTAEFYSLVKEKLAADGIFLQWIPFHGLEPGQYMGILRTYSSVFEHVSIWRMGNAYSLLMATPKGLSIDFSTLVKRTIQKDVWEKLSQVGLENPFMLLTCFSMGEKKIAEMLAPFPRILTDDSPAHLFFPFKATFKQQYSEWPEMNAKHLSDFKESVIPYLTNLSNTEEKAEKIINTMRQYESRF